MLSIQDLLLSSILILQTLAKQPPLSPRLVTTQQGMYRGVLLSPTFPSDAPSCQGCSKLSDHGQKKYSVDAYYGIQYASLLGSKLRFMPPTSSIEKWNGVRLAITHRPVCPQTRRSDGDHGHLDDDDDYHDGGLAISDPDDDNYGRMDGEKTQKMEELKRFVFLRNSSLDEGMIKFSKVRERDMEGYLEKQNEECLFLNVYTPYSTDPDNSSLLPVVVFVHGDSYDSGTGNAYDGSFLSAFGRLVVVTLNYRLGVLDNQHKKWSSEQSKGHVTFSVTSQQSINHGQQWQLKR